MKLQRGLQTLVIPTIATSLLLLLVSCIPTGFTTPELPPDTPEKDIPSTETTPLPEIQEDYPEPDDTTIDALTGLPLPTFQGRTVYISGQIIVTPSGAISGRILYQDKTPVYGCTVHLFDETPFGTFSTAIDYTYTNEKGYYIFDSIRSGVLQLEDGEWKVLDGRTYSIYPWSSSSLTDYYSFPCFDSTAPHASVEVSKHKMTVAPDVLIPREERP